MKGSIILLSGWLTFAVVAGSLLTAPTLPGGVGFGYYLIVASLPLAGFLSARGTNKMSLAFCFGLVSGFILAGPLLTDGQMHFQLVNGTTPPLFGIKMTSFTLLMSLLCAGSFWIGRRVFARRKN